MRTMVLLCLVLLALLAVIQVMHVHPIGDDAGQCPLCIAMHSVVSLVVMATALLLVKLGTIAQVSIGVRASRQYWCPTLFIRPPPAI
jgi:uncharacterized membrane protein YqhA